MDTPKKIDSICIIIDIIQKILYTGPEIVIRICLNREKQSRMFKYINLNYV